MRRPHHQEQDNVDEHRHGVEDVQEHLVGSGSTVRTVGVSRECNPSPYPPVNSTILKIDRICCRQKSSASHLLSLGYKTCQWPCRAISSHTATHLRRSNAGHLAIYGHARVDRGCPVSCRPLIAVILTADVRKQRRCTQS